MGPFLEIFGELIIPKTLSLSLYIYIKVSLSILYEPYVLLSCIMIYTLNILNRGRCMVMARKDFGKFMTRGRCI